MKRIKKIVVEVIPHDKQRYATCGDWIFEEDGVLKIFVSETGNNHSEMAVAVHEIVEALLCNAHGVEQSDVDNFDIEFEKMRETNPKLIGTVEPGDMDTAPYANEHRIATTVERVMVAQFKMTWEDHENAIQTLG